MMVTCRALFMLMAAGFAVARENDLLFVEVSAHGGPVRSHVSLKSRVAPTQTKLAVATADRPSTMVTAHSTADAFVDMEGSYTSNMCAAAMIVILCCTLFALIWMQRDSFQDSSHTEIVANMCVFFYVVLTIIADVLIRKFSQQGLHMQYQFSPAVLTTLIEMGKLIVMLIGALVDWQRTRECSKSEFGKTLLLMTVPAACFVALNLLRYAALSGADLDQYRVWRCTDIVWVALLWFTIFRKKPGFNQIGGIGLVVISCAMVHLKDKWSGNTSPVAVLTILALALVSSLGLVMNEFGMKASTQLSISLQCLALYLITTTLNCFVVIATVPMPHMFQGIGGPQVALIVVDVGLGVAVACVLKYASSMVKQLAAGWLAPVEPLVGHFVVGTAVTPLMVFATMLAGAGSVIYRLPETKQAEKGVPELAKKQPEDVQSIQQTKAGV